MTRVSWNIRTVILLILLNRNEYNSEENEKRGKRERRKKEDEEVKKNRYSCRWFFNSHFSINVMFVVRFLRNLNLGNGEDILSFDKHARFLLVNLVYRLKK